MLLNVFPGPANLLWGKEGLQAVKRFTSWIS